MQTHEVFQLTVVRKGLFKCLHRVGDGSFLFREAGHCDVVSLFPDVEWPTIVSLQFRLYV